MLSDFLDRTTMSLLDYLLDFNEPFTAESINRIARKDTEGMLQKFLDYEIIICDNPEAPFQERIYRENQKNNIFSLALKLDFEISTFMMKKKRLKIKESDILRQAPRERDIGRSHKKTQPAPEKKEIPLEELAKLVNPDV